MKSLTVICPVYLEEEVIEEFYNRLRNVLIRVEKNYQVRILFVVDRCSDNSLEILKRIANSDNTVSILALSSRFGHQMALLAGIDYSNSDAIIMMDSDHQHPPELIPKLIEAYEQGFDIVQTLRHDPHEIDLFKRLSSKAFYWLLNQLSDTPIAENTADFRLISQKVAIVFRSNIRERNMFLRGLFSWVGFNSITIPFDAQIRPGGKSKYSVGKMVRFGIDGILSFSKKPLRAAVVLGFILAILGFILALATTIQYFYTRSFPPGWTTLIILVTIFSGTQLIFMGILGEYIGAIFDEVKARPHYLVEEAINIPNLNG